MHMRKNCATLCSQVWDLELGLRFVHAAETSHVVSAGCSNTASFA